MERKCYARCIVGIPTSILSGKDKKCLSKCADRFLETWNLVLQQIVSNSKAMAQNEP